MTATPFVKRPYAPPAIVEEVPFEGTSLACGGPTTDALGGCDPPAPLS